MVDSGPGVPFNISGNMEESSMSLTARPARREDAPAITEIYNQGIEDRVATFETRPRAVSDILPWFERAYAFVTVVDAGVEVVGYAVAHPYADTPWYRGIGAFSVYVRRSHRGRGVGQVAMAALIEASRTDGLWKLYSRVFPENRASLALMARMGFKEIGVHEKHGKLDGVWKDCINVELLIPESIV
jgi:phosphinothricin acetyltransferase